MADGWTPAGEQTIHAWRRYIGPDGGYSVVDEPVEVTDEMVDRGAAALCVEHGADCPDFHRNRELAVMVLTASLAPPRQRLASETEPNKET